MAKSALLRRRGTRSTQSNKTALVIVLVVALVASALLLGMLLGANLLVTPSIAANVVRKEAAAVISIAAIAKAAAVEAAAEVAAKVNSKVHSKVNLKASEPLEAASSSLEADPMEAFALEAKPKMKTTTTTAAAVAATTTDDEPNDPIANDPVEVLQNKPITNDDDNHHPTIQIHNQKNNPKPDSYPYPLTPIIPADATFTDFVPLGGNRYTEYTNGTSPYSTNDLQLQQASDELARSRRVHVKQAMKFAYHSYETFAFGHDEVLPQTKGHNDNWGGIGTTLVDSLDTLWLMDLKDEFWRARDWVRDTLTHHGSVSVFETTIRSLGGLLSAYDWSGDEAFLEKAKDLGARLFKAFDNPSGIPWGQIDLISGTGNNVGWTGGNAILSELGTLQLEFRYLAKATGTPEYATKSEAVFDILNQMKGVHNGLYSYFIKPGRDGNQASFANNRLTFGAMSDSLYEYMLKVWIQGGKTEPLYRDMYDKAMTGMHEELLQKSTPSGLWFIADKNNDVLDHKMDHLVCFMGGLLALGAYTDPLGLESDRAQRDLTTAKALTYTCYQMYARMKTGISAEFVQFVDDQDFNIGRGAPHYLLRPEAVESFFILNQLTGDPVYREWGWEVFMAIERYCKTSIAYGSLRDVSQVDGAPENKMESFFLAETLKYLYLLQDPDTEVDILTKHVFNTEAHPMRIFPVLEESKKRVVTE
jgi:Glycosyl hydrolase family 47